MSSTHKCYSVCQLKIFWYPPPTYMLQCQLEGVVNLYKHTHTCFICQLGGVMSYPPTHVHVTMSVSCRDYNPLPHIHVTVPVSWGDFVISHTHIHVTVSVCLRGCHPHSACLALPHLEVRLVPGLLLTSHEAQDTPWRELFCPELRQCRA